MLIAAEWGVGQVFWSMLWIFLFVLWIWLIFVIFADIFRSDDLSGWGKAIWSVFVIFLPFLGIFAYLIVRGGGMAERQAAAVQASQAASRAYIRDVAGTTSAADQLATLADLHASGKLDDAEYAAAKAKVIG